MCQTVKECLSDKAYKAYATKKALRSFLQHYRAYAAVKRFFRSDGVICVNPLYEFMTLSSDANLEIACIQWCKVFGSRGDSESVHWSNVLNRLDESRLFSAIKDEAGLCPQQFTEYKDAMLKFRDKFVAHSDKYTEKIPVFTAAVQAAIILDHIITEDTETEEELYEHDLFTTPLGDMDEIYQEDMAEAVSKLIALRR